MEKGYQGIFYFVLNVKEPVSIAVTLLYMFPTVVFMVHLAFLIPTSSQSFNFYILSPSYTPSF